MYPRGRADSSQISTNTIRHSLQSLDRRTTSASRRSSAAPHFAPPFNYPFSGIESNKAPYHRFPNPNENDDPPTKQGYKHASRPGKFSSAASTVESSSRKSVQSLKSLRVRLSRRLRRVATGDEDFTELGSSNDHVRRGDAWEDETREEVEEEELDEDDPSLFPPPSRPTSMLSPPADPDAKRRSMLRKSATGGKSTNGADPRGGGTEILVFEEELATPPPTPPKPPKQPTPAHRPSSRLRLADVLVPPSCLSPKMQPHIPGSAAPHLWEKGTSPLPQAVVIVGRDRTSWISSDLEKGLGTQPHLDDCTPSHSPTGHSHERNVDGSNADHYHDTAALRRSPHLGHRSPGWRKRQSVVSYLSTGVWDKRAKRKWMIGVISGGAVVVLVLVGLLAGLLTRKG